MIQDSFWTHIWEGNKIWEGVKGNFSQEETNILTRILLLALNIIKTGDSFSSLDLRKRSKDGVLFKVKIPTLSTFIWEALRNIETLRTKIIWTKCKMEISDISIIGKICHNNWIRGKMESNLPVCLKDFSQSLMKLP